MLQKIPKTRDRSWLKGGIKSVLVVETLLFFGSFIFWQRLRSSRNTRLYCLNQYPYVLDKYYTFEEFLSPQNQERTLDLEVWKKEGKVPQ